MAARSGCSPRWGSRAGSGCAGTRCTACSTAASSPASPSGQRHRIDPRSPGPLVRMLDLALAERRLPGGDDDLLVGQRMIQQEGSRAARAPPLGIPIFLFEVSALEMADPIRASRLGRALCIGGAALGALGLLGWIAGRESLTAILPGQQPSMKPNTALALLLIGGAGALRHPAGAAGWWRNALSTLAALAVLAIGAATLAEYALGLDLHVDRLLVQHQAGPYPGRPSPPTALALTLLAAAVLLSGVRATA